MTDSTTIELLDAASTGDIARLTSILSRKGVIVNCRNANGDTPLILAAKAGHEAAVEKLLRAGAFAHFSKPSGANALILASIMGYTRIVERLLAAGAKPNHTTKNGSTALSFAVDHGRTGVVEVLLKAGADASHVDGEDDYPLIIAVWKGYTSIVRALVETGSSKERFKSQVRLALIAANQRGDKECRDLLQRCADSHKSTRASVPKDTATTKLGGGSTHVAAVAEPIVEKQPDSRLPNSSDENEPTPATVAVRANAAVILLGQDDGFPFIVAVHKSHGDLDLFCELLEVLTTVVAQCDPMAKMPMALRSVDESVKSVEWSLKVSWSAVEYASYFGYVDILDYLLKGECGDVPSTTKIQLQQLSRRQKALRQM